MTTLLDSITGWMAHDRDKHGLPDDHVEEMVNAMTPMELLAAISEALEEAGVMK